MNDYLELVSQMCDSYTHAFDNRLRLGPNQYNTQGISATYWNISRYLGPLLFNDFKFLHWFYIGNSSAGDILEHIEQRVLTHKEDKTLHVIELCYPDPAYAEVAERLLANNFEQVKNRNIIKLFTEHYETSTRIRKPVETFVPNVRLFQQTESNIIIKLTNYLAKETNSEHSFPETLMMIGLLPVFFKSLFKNIFITEEIEFFQTLVEQTHRNRNSKIADALDKIITLEKYKDIKKKFQYTKLETYIRDVKTVTLKKNLIDNENVFKKLEQDVARTLEHRVEIQKQLLYEEANPIAKDVIDYFINNKYILYMNMNRPNIQFLVKAPLNNYDKEHMELDLKNVERNSFVYKVMSNIFLKDKGYINVIEYISFDLTSGNYSVQSPSGSDMRTHHAIYNPHHGQFTCFGNWRNKILEALKANQFEVAFEYAVASLRNINATDGAVMGWFKDAIADHYFGDTKCIHYNDNDYTFKEYAEVIKKEEEIEKEKEKEAVSNEG